MKTGEDFRREFPEPDENFQDAAHHALLQLHEPQRRPHMRLKPILLISLIIVVLTSVGVAATVERWSMFDFIPNENTNVGEDEQLRLLGSFTPVPIHMERADITIREAVYDGFGLFVVMDIDEMEENAVIVPYRSERMKQNASWTIENAPTDIMLEDYLSALGYEKVYGLLLTSDAGGSSSFRMLQNEDGSFTYLQEFNASLSFSPTEAMSSIQVSAWIYDMYADDLDKTLERASITVPLTALPVLTVKHGTPIGDNSFGNTSLRWISADMYQTAIATYIFCDAETLDPQANDASIWTHEIHVVDEQGQPLPYGPYKQVGATYQHGKEQGDRCYTFIVALDELPSTFALHEYAVDAVNRTYEWTDSVTFALEDAE